MIRPIDLCDKTPLRSPPLSEATFGGSCRVILECGKVTRLSDLVTSYPPTKLHRLLTPEGIREVRIQIGAFKTSCTLLRFIRTTGELVSYPTTLTRTRLNRTSMLELNLPVVLHAFTYEEKVSKFENLTFERRITSGCDTYEYTITPGPIFLGTTRRSVFLPFEVI